MAKLTAPRRVYVSALGRMVDKGETIDVDDQELAAQLLEQGWSTTRAKKAPAKKAGAKQAPVTPPADPASSSNQPATPADQED